MRRTIATAPDKPTDHMEMTPEQASDIKGIQNKILLEKKAEAGKQKVAVKRQAEGALNRARAEKAKEIIETVKLQLEKLTTWFEDAFLSNDLSRAKAINKDKKHLISIMDNIDLNHLKTVEKVKAYQPDYKIKTEGDYGSVHHKRAGGS